MAAGADIDDLHCDLLALGLSRRRGDVAQVADFVACWIDAWAVVLGAAGALVAVDGGAGTVGFAGVGISSLLISGEKEGEGNERREGPTIAIDRMEPGLAGLGRYQCMYLG